MLRLLLKCSEHFHRFFLCTNHLTKSKKWSYLHSIHMPLNFTNLSRMYHFLYIHHIFLLCTIKFKHDNQHLFLKILVISYTKLHPCNDFQNHPNSSIFFKYLLNMNIIQMNLSKPQIQSNWIYYSYISLI
jgi:hypothetical protein